MAPLDMKKIEQEDIKDGENGLPPRFGYKQEELEYIIHQGI